MERRKPLKRGGPLKRTGELRSRSKLESNKPLPRAKPIKARPKPKRSKVEEQASERWHAVTVARGCEVCPRRSEICDGSIHAHHVITQQQLRRRGLAALLWDVDNGMGLCERAHRRHHNRAQPIERQLLREEHLRFADDHGLSNLIERYYPAS